MTSSKALLIIREAPNLIWLKSFLNNESIKIKTATFGFEKGASDYLFSPDITPSDLAEKIMETGSQRVVFFSNQSGLKPDTETAKILLSKGVKAVAQSPKAATLGSNKILQKKFFTKFHFPTAPYRIVRNQTEAIHAADLLGYPMVLKVGGLSDGRKMQFITKAEQIAEYYYENAISEPVIAEKFLDGREISTIVYHNYGKPVVFPLVGKPRTTYLKEGQSVRQRIYIIPDQKLSHVEEAVKKLALSVSKWFGNKYLIGFDIVLDDKGNYSIIECNARVMETLRMSMLACDANVVMSMLTGQKIFSPTPNLTPVNVVVDVPLADVLSKKIKDNKNMKKVRSEHRITGVGKTRADVLPA